MADVLFMEKRGGGGEGELTREDHQDDEKPPPPPRKPATTSSLPSRDALASMFKSIHLDTSPPPPPLSPSSSSSPSRSARHVPKVQSNLLKSPTRASAASAASKTSATKIEVAASRDELVDWVGERERHLVSMKNEYEKHYVEYKQLVVKFYTEKLNNLKHSFKNQILKQKIYFETEMLELTREYWADFEKQQKQQNSSTKSNSPKSNKKSNNTSNINKNKESKNKQLIKLLKDDLRTLVEYMRESLIQSSDTLIEAYETCECLKRLEKTETSISRQYTAMRESTQNLLNKDKSSKANDDNDEKQRDEEQARMDKYKSDLDELMNTLDDIELCHLQRKETLGGCCKLAAKLKSKFKFVESKYETLSRQVAALKFESYVYRELWAEKLRSDQQQSASNMRSASRSTSTSSLVDVDCDVSSQCQRDEFIVIGASSSSSSSSMMSNHEQNDTVEHLIPLIDEFDLSDSNSTSSSDDDASSSDSAASDLPNENLRNMGENETSNESKSSSSSSLPASDYNRKLALITDLINLHKSKSSSYNNTTNTNNDVWYNNSTTTTTQTQQSPQKPSTTASKERQNSPTSTRRRQSQQQRRILHHSHHRSSLGLIECSYEGDRVSVENCDLRRDCDLTGWLLERRIDGLVDIDEELVVVESTLPANSVVRSGKALCVLQPFGRRHNHIEEILTALKLASSAPLTITTRLLTPDRIPVAAHTQEVPHFYREIFKYANLIHFVS